MNTVQKEVNDMLFAKIAESMKTLLDSTELLWNLRKFNGNNPFFEAAMKRVHLNPGRATGKTQFIVDNFNSTTDLIILPGYLMKNELMSRFKFSTDSQQARTYERIYCAHQNFRGFSLNAKRVWIDEPGLCFQTPEQKRYFYQEFIPCFRRSELPTFILMGE